MRLSVLLDCHSYFSFGMGASSPSRLIERAAELGYSAVALVDDSRGPRTIVWRFPIPVCGTSYRTTLSPFPKV